MAFTVVLDACVLFSPALRDLLIRLGQTNLFRARYSEAILAETRAAVMEARPQVTLEGFERTMQLMRTAIRDVMVDYGAALEQGIQLPDAGDRHVVATAITCNAQAIVTFNLRDFPKDALEPYKIEAIHPDAFLIDLFDLSATTMCRILTEQAASLKNPPSTPDKVINSLSVAGVPRTSAKYEELMRQ